MWEKGIWSYGAFSPLSTVFSTLLEKSPPVLSSLKLSCPTFLHFLIVCVNHTMIKTENNIIVPSNSISLRTKFKINVVNIDHFHLKVPLYQSYNEKKTKNKNNKKNLTLSAIPTLHSENNRFSLCPDSYFAQGRFRN